MLLQPSNVSLLKYCMDSTLFSRILMMALVASSTEEEHSEHLKMVFERFQQYGLRINVSKSVMGVSAQVEYLGFLITAEGSRPLPEKVQAIFNYYKLPETIIHDLRTFLGMINFIEDT
ncbi:retrovirus-related Pol polyprotein from transposon opus [Trichonephila clavipes]|nr:retrovirus-related Pol polyprotein from transposon opus [Trichonephila clavipes]